MPRKPTRAKALGVTDDEYQRLLDQQGGHCALCPNTPKRLKKDGTPYRLHVDHDHKTGEVRGLLCWPCNDSLPYHRDAKWLYNAALYVAGFARMYPDDPLPWDATRVLRHPETVPVVWHGSWEREA